MKLTLVKSVNGNNKHSKARKHCIFWNAKSLKSQAPQGFSGCLDIENDEMNKKKFLSASPRVKQTLRSL